MRRILMFSGLAVLIAGSAVGLYGIVLKNSLSYEAASYCTFDERWTPQQLTESRDRCAGAQDRLAAATSIGTGGLLVATVGAILVAIGSFAPAKLVSRGEPPPPNSAGDARSGRP